MVTWSIRPAERALTGALAAYFFFIVAALYLMKPARNSLFLDSLGADKLPWVYFATALVTWWVVVAYVRLATRANLMAIIQVTLVATLACLAGFWLWLSRSDLVSPLFFYVWVKIYGVLLPSQFWLLSEEFLDPRQAKRLFGPIGAGGILGGIAGSAAAGTLPTRLGTHALLGIAGLAVIGAFLVFRWIASELPSGRVAGRGGQRDDDHPDARFAFREITPGMERHGEAGALDDPATSTSRTPQGRALIFTIVAILIVAATAHTIVDWQFNKAAEDTIFSRDARTAFFGQFFTVLNVVTLAVQMLATSFVLRFFGIGVALALLPLALATGAIGILRHEVVEGAAIAVDARGGSLPHVDDEVLVDAACERVLADEELFEHAHDRPALFNGEYVVHSLGIVGGDHLELDRRVASSESTVNAALRARPKLVQRSHSGR